MDTSRCLSLNLFLSSREVAVESCGSVSADNTGRPCSLAGVLVDLEFVKSIADNR